MKVFQRQSQQESMILHVKPHPSTDLTTMGSTLLGKSVYVNWPHLKEGLVIGVSESSSKMNLVDSQVKWMYETINETEWHVLKKRITET